MRLTYLFLTCNIVSDAKLNLILFHRNDKIKKRTFLCNFVVNDSKYFKEKRSRYVILDDL